MDRICVFIDGSGFYFGLKRNSRPTRVDYHQLSKAIAGPDRELVRTYYYNSAYDPELFPEQYKAQQTFLDSLLKTPCLDLRLGRMVPSRAGGFKEKGAAVLLASEMIYYAAKKMYDTAIVITEDQNFAPVLNQLKELGPCVELGLFKDMQPRELVRSADQIIPLDEVMDKFAFRIFPEMPEDNFGNQLEEGPLKAGRFKKG